MKVFHLSDLHIGKELHDYSLKESQREVLCEIVAKAEEYRPDVILIAGDIYDKTVPSGEAYGIFDEFLNRLAAITPAIPVLMIAGNHDNAMRLKFASAFFEKHQIYIAVFPPQSEEEYLRKIVLNDEYGPVNFYLLPFTKPGYVKKLFPEGTVEDYNRAIQALLEREQIDEKQRNVLVAHQFFVSGEKEPDTCDSELAYICVGGLDCVDTKCVQMFDYVALGHLHGPQSIGADFIRYSGTPLKYSISEEFHKKGITMVTLEEKGHPLQIESLPLHAQKDVRSIKGTLEEVIADATDENRADYVSITLTDEEGIYRPKDQLEEHYDNILEVKIDNLRTRSRLEETQDFGQAIEPLEAFREFYQAMNAQPLSEAEEKVMAEVIDQARDY